MLLKLKLKLMCVQKLNWKLSCASRKSQCNHSNFPLSGGVDYRLQTKL